MAMSRSIWSIANCNWNALLVLIRVSFLFFSLNFYVWFFEDNVLSNNVYDFKCFNSFLKIFRHYLVPFVRGIRRGRSVCQSTVPFLDPSAVWVPWNPRKVPVRQPCVASQIDLGDYYLIFYCPMFHWCLCVWSPFTSFLTVLSAVGARKSIDILLMMLGLEVMIFTMVSTRRVFPSQILGFCLAPTFRTIPRPLLPPQTTLRHKGNKITYHNSPSNLPPMKDFNQFISRLRTNIDGKSPDGCWLTVRFVGFGKATDYFRDNMCQQQSTLVRK